MRFQYIFILLFLSNLLFAQTAESYFDKSVIKYNKLNYKEAIRLLDSAIILNSGYSEAYNARGLAKGYIQDYKGAIADYNNAIEINPDYGMAYHNRGIAKRNDGDLKGGCDDWNIALAKGIVDVNVLLSMFCKDIIK
jgi:tetratricopeptide (TPR) repeat protein